MTQPGGNGCEEEDEGQERWGYVGWEMSRVGWWVGGGGGGGLRETVTAGTCKRKSIITPGQLHRLIRLRLGDGRR